MITLSFVWFQWVTYGYSGLHMVTEGSCQVGTDSVRMSYVCGGGRSQVILLYCICYLCWWRLLLPILSLLHLPVSFVTLIISDKGPYFSISNHISL